MFIREFYKDPTAHLINKMMERGFGMGSRSDAVRSFIISKIPGFLEKVKSPDYLRSFALEYFKDSPELDKIMGVFDKSINGSEFKKELNLAVAHFEKKEYHEAEKQLRVALTIFSQSKNLETYKYPVRANLE